MSCLQTANKNLQARELTTIRTSFLYSHLTRLLDTSLVRRVLQSSLVGRLRRGSPSRRDILQPGFGYIPRRGGLLPRRGEELQRDVVGIAEREPRTVRGVNDAAVRQCPARRASTPTARARLGCRTRTHMVQSRPALVKGVRAVRIRELVEAHQGLAAQQPDDVMERSRILVEHGRAADEVLVPGATPFKVRDGQSHVGYAGNSGTMTSLKRVDRHDSACRLVPGGPSRTSAAYE